MDITSFLGQWNLGGDTAPTVIADTGATAMAGTSPTTLTATVATVMGNQPQVNRCKAVLSIYGLNVATIIGAIDFSISDGTNTEFVGTVAASGAATAGQGGEYCVEIFNSTIKVTNIVSVTARIADSGTTIAGTARLYVLGCP